MSAAQCSSASDAGVRTFAGLGLGGARALFVANGGGHLAELGRIVESLGASRSSTCVTFDSDQARNMPWVDDVRFVRYVGPRDLVNTVRAARSIRTIIAEGGWDAVLSTGAAVAISALPLASRAGIRSIYIESYARFLGPSTTGRILARAPGRYELYTQHAGWARDGWCYSGSVLDSIVRGDERLSSNRPLVFVTLGTIQPYRFDCLVDGVLAHAPRDAQFVWQLGATMRTDLPGITRDYLTKAEFAVIAREASVVVSHAGVGTAMELIEMGHRPILVPRRSARREHVDDHQVQIADEFARRGLVVTRDAGMLDARAFELAVAG